jgi:hypothetical protein
MLKLLRKDFILSWKILAFSYGAWGVLWLGEPWFHREMDMNAGLWSGMVAGMCGFLPIIIVTREDKFKAAALTCSLPVRRATIVASRYVGGWLVALTCALLAVVSMYLLSWWVGAPAAPESATLVTMVAIMGLSIALMMPFTLRFGVAGVIILLVALQLTGILVLVGAALLGLPAGFIGRGADAALRAGQRVHETLGTTGFSAMVVFMVLVLNVASCRLSAWVYERREF